MLIESTGPQPLECPKCGKRVLVQQTVSRFKCLNCGFFSDISDEAQSGQVLLLVFVVIILLVLLLR
jgi:uncharacterized protein (DUF983 family)